MGECYNPRLSHEKPMQDRTDAAAWRFPSQTLRPIRARRGTSMRHRFVTAGSLAAVVFLMSDVAFARPFPGSAKRGTMTPAPYPEIVVNGKSRQLVPGARIWNAENLIEMPAALRGSNFTVNYTETDQGDIDRVWILTPEEAKEPIAQQTNSPAK